MKRQIGRIVKGLARRVPSKIPLRLAAEALQREQFSALSSLPSFARREQLWDLVRKGAEGRSLLYLEFGVFEGYSIRNWAESDRSSDSRFYGFDTFEGLPEDWNGVPKGTFDVGSQMPSISDPRVCFFKGMFQDTWPDAQRAIEAEASGRHLVVHFDADLYSSTLFVLCKLDSLGLGYDAIFDEFYGDEPRALADYAVSHLPAVRLIGSANRQITAAARIVPRRASTP